MSRVDLVGPVGVGKSTLLQAMADGRASEDRWLTPAEADARIAASRIRGAADQTIWQRLAWHIPPMRRRMHDRVLRSIRQEAPWHASAEWADFLSACLHFRASDPREARRIFMSHGRLALRVAEAVMWDTHLPDRVVVTDESLIHATLPMVVSSDQAHNLDAIARFYGQMPPPAGIVHLQGSLELNFERLMARERSQSFRVISIRGLSDADVLARLKTTVDIVECAVAVMESRNVAVLRVDASWSQDRQRFRAGLFAAEVAGVRPEEETS